MMALRINVNRNFACRAGMGMPNEMESYKEMKEIAEDAESTTTHDDAAI